MNRRMVITQAACFLMGGVVLCRTTTADQGDANVALGRKVFAEIYGNGKVELVDQLYADDFVDDSPGGGKGRELIKEAVAGFHRAMPDLRIEFEDVFAAGDKVVLRYAAHGTQTGPYFEIPPTGKTITVRGITIFQIVNGKIKTEWTEYDRLGDRRQLRVGPR